MDRRSDHRDVPAPPDAVGAGSALPGIGADDAIGAQEVSDEQLAALQADLAPSLNLWDSDFGDGVGSQTRADHGDVVGSQTRADHHGVVGGQPPEPRMLETIRLLADLRQTTPTPESAPERSSGGSGDRPGLARRLEPLPAAGGMRSVSRRKSRNKSGASADPNRSAVAGGASRTLLRPVWSRPLRWAAGFAGLAAAAVLVVCLSVFFRLAAAPREALRARVEYPEVFDADSPAVLTVRLTAGGDDPSPGRPVGGARVRAWLVPESVTGTGSPSPDAKTVPSSGKGIAVPASLRVRGGGASPYESDPWLRMVAARWWRGTGSGEDAEDVDGDSRPDAIAAEAVSGPDGRAVLRIDPTRIPGADHGSGGAPEGLYRLVIEGTSPGGAVATATAGRAGAGTSTGMANPTTVLEGTDGAPLLRRVRVERPVLLTRPVRVLVSTDRPVARAGGSLNAQAHVFRRPSGVPAAGLPVEFRVLSAGGHTHATARAVTDRFGRANAPLTVREELGFARVVALVFEGGGSGGAAATGRTLAVSESPVHIGAYRLPAARLELTPDRDWWGPGDLVGGRVRAVDLQGRPLARADVEVALLAPQAVTGNRVGVLSDGSDAPDGTREVIRGRTNAEGVFRFGLAIPTAVALPGPAGDSGSAGPAADEPRRLLLRAALRPPAPADAPTGPRTPVPGRSGTRPAAPDKQPGEEKSQASAGADRFPSSEPVLTARVVTVSPRPLVVRVVPDSPRVVPGVPNRFHVAVSRPDGTPQPARIRLVPESAPGAALPPAAATGAKAAVPAGKQSAHGTHPTDDGSDRVSTDWLSTDAAGVGVIRAVPGRGEDWTLRLQVIPGPTSHAAPGAGPVGGPTAAPGGAPASGTGKAPAEETGNFALANATTVTWRPSHRGTARDLLLEVATPTVRSGSTLSIGVRSAVDGPVLLDVLAGGADAGPGIGAGGHAAAWAARALVMHAGLAGEVRGGRARFEFDIPAGVTGALVLQVRRPADDDASADGRVPTTAVSRSGHADRRVIVVEPAADLRIEAAWKPGQSVAGTGGAAGAAGSAGADKVVSVSRPELALRVADSAGRGVTAGVTVSVFDGLLRDVAAGRPDLLADYLRMEESLLRRSVWQSASEPARDADGLSMLLQRTPPDGRPEESRAHAGARVRAMLLASAAAGTLRPGPAAKGTGGSAGAAAQPATLGMLLPGQADSARTAEFEADRLRRRGMRPMLAGAFAASLILLGAAGFLLLSRAGATRRGGGVVVWAAVGAGAFFLSVTSLIPAEPVAPGFDVPAPATPATPGVQWADLRGGRISDPVWEAAVATGDGADVLLWVPDLVTGPDGRATVRTVAAADGKPGNGSPVGSEPMLQRGTWRTSLCAVTEDGRLGVVEFPGPAAGR